MIAAIWEKEEREGMVRKKNNGGVEFKMVETFKETKQ